jgi:micrococcal nuclease
MIVLAILAAVAPLVPVKACVVKDGDTIRCGVESIRLSGIDSPELPGHCRVGRICALGDPYAAKANMVALIRSGPVTIRRLKRDLYGRTIAVVYAGGVNVSCTQLSGGFAIFKPKWDARQFIKRECSQ